MSLLLLNTEQYSSNAITLNPNVAFQDHNTNPQITTQSTLSAVYFPHRVLRPCALQVRLPIPRIDPWITSQHQLLPVQQVA